MGDTDTSAGYHETCDVNGCQYDHDKLEQGCKMEMEKTTMQYQVKLEEVTHPILVSEDCSHSNFPIGNTHMMNIDSDGMYKIETSTAEVDHSNLAMTIGELGLNNYVIASDKRDELNDVVTMKSGVLEAPPTTVDDDDGFKTILTSALCGVKKGKVIDDDGEQYKTVQENLTYRKDKIPERDNGKKSPMKQSSNIGKRLAFHDIQENEIYADVEEPKETNSTRESNRQPLYHKRSDIRTPGTAVPYPSQAKTESYPNQTNVQILDPVVHRTVPARSTHSRDSDVYNFTHGQRGYMLVIVNDRFVRQSPRDGAHWDLIKMKEIARKFGFRSLNYNHDRNLSKSETFQLLHKAKNTDHSDCDCFVFMISTHGLEQRNATKGGKLDHALVCADDQLIFTSTIMDMFSDSNCPTLKGKPKIFFIQACRGEELDHGSDVFVAFPTNEDKTCSILNDGQRGRCMRESFDVSDTKWEQDSWAEGDETKPSARHQQSSITSISQTLLAPTIQSFYVPKVQHTHTGGTHPTMLVHHAPSKHISKIYAPTPYAIVETPSLKCHNDMLVMFAIPPGLFAWRNTSDGSWMIDYLNQILMAYDMRRPKSFLNLLTKVSALMSRRTTNTPSNPSLHAKKAVSVIEHKLTKDIVFEQKVPSSG